MGKPQLDVAQQGGTLPKLRAIYALLALGFVISGLTLWAAWNPVPDFSDKITEIISDRTFVNQEVPIDGKEYINCTFKSVTFVWNGTASFQFRGGTIIAPVRVHTNNDAVWTTFALLRGMGIVRPDIPLTTDNQPTNSVQPPNIIRETNNTGQK